MKITLIIFRLVFCLCLALLFSIPILLFFKPIFLANSLTIPYAIYPFDICEKAPIVWKYFKLSYVITLIFVCILFSNLTVGLILKSKLNSKTIKKSHTHLSGLNLYIGDSFSTNFPIYLTEKSLYQNILITGTIGTGKTSSSMYPFAKQLIGYKSNFDNEKLGMLILDVKGNFYKQVKKYALEVNRLDDLYVIELGSNITYNPLDKPDLKPSVLANRLKTILTLFSPNNSESYWLDKAEEVLAECIKLCRLYNENYVTFTELHKLINSPNYYTEKINLLRDMFKLR